MTSSLVASSESPPTLPIVDLAPFLDDPSSPSAREQCALTAEALITHGALLLHDPRVSLSDNEAFLDLLEDYFTQPEHVLRHDTRPELGYQIGVTLENTERPKCAAHTPCLDVINRLAPSERPLDISAHSPDPKCRFFWRMADPPPYPTAYPALNAPNVVPDVLDAPSIRVRWEPTMNRWGAAMRSAVDSLCEMAALGLGLPATTFRDAGRYGPHLLAPTASDLRRHGREDTILAGFHTDLNFLTIHGRSRYPGLHVWARNTGRRIDVVIPPGNYLIVQAGKQLEHLTGGLVRAGYHEVVVNARTIEAMQRREERPDGRQQVRISSTFFWHLASDYDLAPIPELANRASAMGSDGWDAGKGEDGEGYPAMKVGEQVQRELKHIKLMA